MSNSYRQGPDGHIDVVANGITYSDTPENFTLDFGAQPPALPAGIREQSYDQAASLRTMVTTYGEAITSLVSWPEANAVISAGATLAGRQNLRRNPVLTFEQQRAAKSAEIDRAREAALNAGFIFGGHAYDSNQRSRDNIVGEALAATRGDPFPAGYVWRTADNQSVPFTAPDVIALAQALRSHIQAQYVKSWTLKAQAAAATTLEQLNSITW